MIRSTCFRCTRSATFLYNDLGSVPDWRISERINVVFKGFPARRLCWKSNAMSKELISELYVSFISRQLWIPCLTSNRISTGSKRRNFSTSLTLVGFKKAITAMHWITFSMEASSVNGIVMTCVKPNKVQVITVWSVPFSIDSMKRGASESWRLHTKALCDRQADSTQRAKKASSPL